MPRVNNLNAPTKNDPPKNPDVFEKQTITKADVGTVDAASLIETKPGGAVALKLPDFLEQVSMPETVGGDQTGYVGFASSASAKWSEQQAAGLEDGQPYLFHEQRYIKTPNKALEFFLLSAESFQSLMVGKEGKFQWISRDLDIEGPTAGSNKTQPHYVGLLLVNVNDNLIPIKGDFIGTKSSGFETAIRAVEAAGNPQWLQLSDEHKVTAAFPKPFGRVSHRITTKYQVAKTSGNSYYRTNCMSKPATASQIQLLYKFLSDSDFIDTLNEAKKNYDMRIQFLDNIAKNGPSKAG